MKSKQAIHSETSLTFQKIQAIYFFLDLKFDFILLLDIFSGKEYIT